MGLPWFLFLLAILSLAESTLVVAIAHEL
jgi:hypothetical protein